MTSQTASSRNSDATNHDDKVRLDKWLWAARFYKTRAIARDMIQGGKVHYNGQRAKPSKLVELGAEIKLHQGYDEKVVHILKISDQRKGAAVAQTLYEETKASVEKREQASLARKNNTFFAPSPLHKPDKKQRRELIKLKLN